MNRNEKVKGEKFFNIHVKAAKKGSTTNPRKRSDARARDDVTTLDVYVITMTDVGPQWCQEILEKLISYF